MEPEVYCGYNKNKRIIHNSSSGGIFYILAKYVIRKLNGAVYGCVCTGQDVFHTRATTIKEITQMMGSKYVKSRLGNTFAMCYKDIENGKAVLFSGTPCEINALHFYLNRKNCSTNKLILLDFFCHGVPEQEYWKRYFRINKFEPNSFVSFRYKKNGWENYYIKIGEYESIYNKDPYIKLFLGDKTLSKSCYECKSKGENRKSDITLADFWGINNTFSSFKNENGTSLMMVRGHKDLLLKIISKYAKLKKIPYIESFFEKNNSYFLSSKKPNNVVIHDSDLLVQNKEVYKKKEVITIKKIVKKVLLTIFIKIDHKPSNILNNKKRRSKNNTIGIITEHGYYNYGNRLQNYALLMFLKRHNKKPRNINFIKEDITIFRKIYNILKKYKPETNNINKKAILETAEKYEGNTFFFFKSKRKQKKLCKFETIIVGGDQVWNASYHPYRNDLEYSMGNFGIVNRPYKLISYAPSICLNQLTEKQKMMFSSLKNFDYVSVREISSAKLLSQLDIKATAVLDPVFLLSNEEWALAINKYSKTLIPNNDYNLYYLLGDNEVFFDTKTNKIINILKDPAYDKINHFDFISLIRGSSLVVTDSFHALAFSVLFRKKVLLKKRNYSGMEKRIEDFLSLLNIVAVYDSILDFSLIDNKNLDIIIDYSKKYLLKSIS